MAHKIKDLADHLQKLNDSLATQGHPPHDDDTWHKYLTHNGHVVRQVWVKNCLYKDGIGLDQATKLRAAVNARLLTFGLPPIDTNGTTNE